ncbi:spondin-2-like [Stegostoma tigrinum]|uniref:spondin-2-like n=1 Tax=Stegostoma tigrinum TaxID=3053191 RepID=UPI00202AE87C|nr:spondin-2-like [Stegostoma tigrinum]
MIRDQTMILSSVANRAQMLHKTVSKSAFGLTDVEEATSGAANAIDQVDGCAGGPMEPLICLWNVLEMLCLIVSAGGHSFLPCPSHGAASYSLTFEGKWKPSAFPKQYPMYRPPAQWSPLIAVTHNDDYHLWQLDSLASAGVREYAEKGTHTILAQEVEETKSKMHSIAGLFKGPAIPSGIGQRLMKVTVYPTHPLLSFMVRIVPSPDWFVGGDSIILCEANHWKEFVTLDLYPYDAGTDSGFAFSSPNFATVPQDKITQITSSFPNHGANSFYYPRLRHLPPMATVTLQKLKDQQSVNEHTGNLNSTPHGGEMESVLETPLDCKVSSWSSWGLCNGDCTQFGTRSRTRFIHTWPSSSGTPCPDLEQKRKCIPRNCF